MTNTDASVVDGRATVPTDTLGDHDLHLFAEGTHLRLHDKLGAHAATRAGVEGFVFRVWAPNALDVRLVGDFNGWDRDATPMHAVRGSGIWEVFVPGLGAGQRYKFHIRARDSGYSVDKADPFGFHAEVAPQTASVTWSFGHTWNDAAWMRERAGRGAPTAPIAIYEVHLGSWRRRPDGTFLDYAEAGRQLADHVVAHGFTHVELLPITEHPFYGSWGYQTTGYFAATSRYGTPDQLMALIDTLHQRGVGVILDWVPSHFPTDEAALGYFDGTHLFEHADPRQGFHPDWGSAIFNYGRHEVRSFLLSNAMFWLERFHFDGLRVDAVASMLYLDYSRKQGEWIPNVHGGRENLEAIDFLQRFNRAVKQYHPDVITIAEESTAWPRVTGDPDIGGLGFSYKWDMGWMHDTLAYMAQDPIHRRYHHGHLTFRPIYAWSECFVMPLSHDEVVHGKGSLLGKMPGDDWQKFANLRLLLSNMYLQPGKKLLFMGAELAPWREWAHEGQLEWFLPEEFPAHRGISRLVGDLNALYRGTRALHELDCDSAGFEWIDHHDVDQSIIAFLRRDDAGGMVLVALNHTPVPRDNYVLGVPKPGRWREILNTDAAIYGGSGRGNLGGVDSSPAGANGRPHSVVLSLPPLAAVAFQLEE